jgi:hypothetical protein
VIESIRKDYGRGQYGVKLCGVPLPYRFLTATAALVFVGRMNTAWKRADAFRVFLTSSMSTADYSNAYAHH